MKKSVFKVASVVLAMVLLLTMFSSCSQQGEQGPAGPTGPQGEQGIQGVKGEDGHTPIITIQNGYWYIDGVNTNQSANGISGATGNGISNIAKTSTEGLVDTYTITYTNGTTTTFTVTNGAQGIQGIQGVPGKDGHSPVITIQDGYWYIDGVNTNEVVGEGVKGDTGNGISDISKTKTEGLVDTYTITFTNGDTTTFTVTNGAAGAQGQQGIQGIQGEKGEDGHTPVITIQNGNWYIDGVDSGKSAEGIKGDTGNGISSIAKTSTEGLVDTYTITFTNGNTTTFTVTNGAQGEPGVGIANAYINSDVHLILVLTNGTTIDAGYVGVSATKSYTVIFKDHNGTILKTESVYENESATAPTVNDRIGYRFTGWSCTFDSVTTNLEVVAQYEVEHNQLYFSYKDNGDNTMTATLVLCGDVNLYGLEFELLMDTVGLIYKNVTAKTSGAGVNYNTDRIKLSYVCDTGSNVTQEITLLEITFDITGTNYSVEFSLNNVDAFDDVYATETYSLANATYHN